MRFCLPSGIGDVSWAYSKLKHVGPAHYEVADGWPHRTTPYLEMLDNVESATYGNFNYQDIIKWEAATGIGEHPHWADVQKRGFDTLLLQPNRHLEQGKRIETWMPDLPTDFHYPIHVPEHDIEKAHERMKRFKLRPITAISAASYRGSEAWKTWGYKEWSPFLKAWHAEVGGTILLIGGFWDDLTDTLCDDGYPSIVGKTSVGTIVELLRQFDYYIGFSSGLGVIRTVLKKNAFCLWPDFQKELSDSWAPPDMLESGMYIAQPWRDPELVIKRARAWLRRIT